MKIIALFFALLVASGSSAFAGTIEMEVNGLVCAFALTDAGYTVMSIPREPESIDAVRSRLKDAK